MNKALKRFKRVKFANTRFGKVARFRRAARAIRSTSISAVASVTIKQIQCADGSREDKARAISNVISKAVKAINELI